MDSGSQRDIDTLLGPISKLNGNIALLNVKDNLSVDLAIAIDVIDALLRYFPGQKFFLIPDCRKILSSASIDALEYVTQHEEFNKYCVAQAIVTDNLPITLLANFYATTLMHNKNVKLVKNMPEAENWINSKANLLELR